MTATYWEVGRRIVEFEQRGENRAEYGESLLLRLSVDLTLRFGKGFGKSNLFQMRKFYMASAHIFQTMSGKLEDHSVESPIFQTLSGISGKVPIAQTSSAKSSSLALTDLARAFPLPWSHYVQLISHSRSSEAFAFYQTEALRGGWSVRQLRRQMDSQFYERTALSKNKTKMLRDGTVVRLGDALTADEEVKDPLVLEFLGLKDEYSESELEDALVHHLEHFLLELGNDFAFIARQRRLRIDDEWYRVDLLLFIGSCAVLS